MTWNTEAVAHLQSREGYMPRWAFWCDARNRDTGESEASGIWQGEDHEVFTIDGQQRTFAGAQGNLEIGEIRRGKGLNVRSLTVKLSGLSPDVQQLLKTYDVRGRQCEVFLMLLDPQTGQLIGINREFKGYVNMAPETFDADEGAHTVQLDLVSHFRDLTTTPNIYKSNAAQSALGGDTFARDSTMADAVDDKWG